MSESVRVSVYAAEGISATASNRLDSGGCRILDVNVDCGVAGSDDELRAGVDGKSDAAGGAEFDPVMD